MITALFVIAAAAHFDVRPDDALIDEPVAISVSGVAPGSRVTIALRGWGGEPQWSSSATFAADANGVVDLTRMAPERGDYQGVDPMGLFWSARRDSFGRGEIERGVSASRPPPQIWHLTASVDRAVVATATITRRAVADDVGMTAIHDRGLAGVFYPPPAAGRHPAVLVLSGSGGGVTPASSFPGGLASRGYAVLALAYFGVEGLPPRLHDIPIESFGTALEWLAAQPSVDPQRIGVVGVSRGGELALLLGSIFPQIRSVVAYLPSDSIVGGCCSVRNEASWTIGGRPLRLRAPIQVERIKGAVLLISGRSDRVWPSTEMSNAIMARLDRSQFPWPHEHLAYDDAGHGIGRPYLSTMDVDHVRHPLTGRVFSLGGTPAGTARARADSWPHVLAFLEKNLRGAGP